MCLTGMIFNSDLAVFGRSIKSLMFFSGSRTVFNPARCAASTFSRTPPIGRKMSLEQVKAARLVRDYEGRFGAAQGTWTTDAFIEAAYRSLSPARPAAGAR